MFLIMCSGCKRGAAGQMLKRYSRFTTGYNEIFVYDVVNNGMNVRNSGSTSKGSNGL